MYINYSKRSEFVRQNKDFNLIGKQLIESIIENACILPSDFILGKNSQNCLLEENILLENNTHTTIIYKKSLAGIETILTAIYNLKYHDEKKAILCASGLNQEYLKPNNITAESIENIEKIAERNHITAEHMEEYLARSNQRYMKNKEIDDEINQSIYTNQSNGISATLVTRSKLNNESVKIIGISKYIGPKTAASQSPIFAAAKLFKKYNLHPNDFDFFEIHEDSALTPILFERAFQIPDSKVNIYGGACVIGDSSSIYIINNLIRALMEQTGKKTLALAAIGNQDGESIAIALELAK